MAIVLRKDTSDPSKPVVFITSDSEDKDKARNETFITKDIYKKYRAFYNGKAFRWEWKIMKPEVTDMVINLATKAVDEANVFLEFKDRKIADIVKALSDIEEGLKRTGGDASSEDKNEVMNKLRGFVRELSEEVDARRFGEKIQNYLIFMSNKRGYSFNNLFLIYIQRPDAKDVRSKTRWAEVGYQPRQDAVPIILLRPKIRPYTASEKLEIEKEFRQKNGLSPAGPISDPVKRAKLEAKLKAGVAVSFDYNSFIPYNTYDRADVVAIDGKEQADIDNIDWFAKSGNQADKADAIFYALEKSAKENNIQVVAVDDLGGARGVSQSGKISYLSSESGESRLETFVHEFAHEILHQSFLKTSEKENQSNKDKGFLELYVGRDSTKIVELQAEATSYVVLKNYDINADTAPTYIALFDNDRSHIEQNLEVIAKTANKIIELIEKNLSDDLNEGRINNKLTKDDVAAMLGVSMVMEEQKIREMVKQIIKEEVSQLDMKNFVSHILSQDFIKYILSGSFKKETFTESAYVEYEFLMSIPKGDRIIDGLSDPMEIEEMLEQEFGTYTYNQGSYTKTTYRVEDRGENVLVSVTHRSGYDI